MISLKSPDNPYLVPHGRRVAGRLSVPTSKSITQRYLNLALLSQAPLILHRPLIAEDIEHYLGSLADLGVGIELTTDTVTLTPGELPSQATIFCGAGGTMMRFLTAALCTLPGTWLLDGIARLRQRPLAPLIDALGHLGADVMCNERPGFAPLEIRGGRLQGGRATLDAGISSQYLSALLMACLRAEQETLLEVNALTSAPYVQLTLDAIERFGGRVESVALQRFLIIPSQLAGGELTVEGDDSAAAYPAAAAALCRGRVELLGLRRDSRQGDRAFIDLLVEMGAQIRWTAAGLEVAGDSLRGVEADLSAMPDQVPTLAALAPFARGTTHIRNVPHLRHKESDRLHAMASELTRLGAVVEELPDGLIIPGVWSDAVTTDQPVAVDTHGDHRIAMSLALVGLRRPNVTILDPGVVAKSYPGFWEELESLLHDG